MLTITLLGTAATMPLPERALTAAVAECGGHSLLLDCGEGTQAAAHKAGVNLMRADAICLTHYHGDHIFGLPGLLQTLGAQGRTRPLALLGPEGLPDIWAAVRALTGPLPYAVRPQVLQPGKALALDAIGTGEGWPAGAQLVPFATKHRVKSIGYRLELPRAVNATAALDAQTAHEITQDILSLTGITRVVVTHRLEASLLECYDEILVLKDGRIAETGTFAELVQRGGYFSAMYKLAH